MAILSKKDLKFSGQTAERRSSPETASAKKYREADTEGKLTKAAYDDFGGMGSSKTSSGKASNVATPMKDPHYASKAMSSSEQSARTTEVARPKAAVKPVARPTASKPKMTSAQADAALKKINDESGVTKSKAAWDRGAGTGLKNGGKTKCMAKGGLTSGRGDGIASKGKTKCKYV